MAINDGESGRGREPGSSSSPALASVVTERGWSRTHMAESDDASTARPLSACF